MHSLAHQHHSTEPTGLSGMPVEMFTNGNAGTMFDGPWRIAGLRTAGMPDESWDVAPMLSGPVGKPAFVHVDGVQIANASPHPESVEMVHLPDRRSQGERDPDPGGQSAHGVYSDAHEVH